MMKNKIRLSLLVAALTGLCGGAMAQNLDQGRKFLYYQRYKSAKDVFDKMLASNPNDINAIYWQGQTLLAMKDSTAAGDLYSKALQTNGTAPLLLAGMGEVELRLGKTADARQRFETALSLSKGKDIDVLNAIADANIDPKAGDATYAIEKLNLATQVKKFNDARTYVLMGDAYRKLIDGGNAVQSYNKALTIDPKYAEAKYKIGKVYLTQNNKDYFLPAFEEAVQADPAYAPAYFELFYYWYYHDVNKAQDYLNKYVANADPGPEVEFLKIDYLYAASKFAEAKTAAQAMITQMGDKAIPRLYKLVAYACDTLQDMACATQNMTTYFQKQDPTAVLGADYAELANIQSKASDSATRVQAIGNYKLAIQKDTLPANKSKYLAAGIDLSKKLGYKSGVAELAAIEFASKPNPNQTDVYNFGIANYQAGNFKTADSIFCGIYESKWPAEIFGYLWCARSKIAQEDTAHPTGIALEAYDKLAAIARSLDSTAKAAGSADSTKYKGQAVSSYMYLAGFYNDIKKDKNTAIAYLEKVLEVDPANESVRGIVEKLKKPAPTRQPAARPAAGGTKPKTGK